MKLSCRQVSPKILLLGCFLLFQPVAYAGELEPAVPESVGLSSQRLRRIDTAMQAEIDAGHKAGVAVLIARKNKLAYFKAFGYADLEDRTRLQTDAYFRVYSMTKPIVSVALLMLYEEGKFLLTDPLEKHIPAFKNVRVYAGDDETGKMILEAPKRKITVQDVFCHTAGFSYGKGPVPSVNRRVERAYVDAGVSYDKLDSLRELAVEKMPTLPLVHHPGERWVYSFAHDVQAYLVEHFSGMPIDRFLKERIFEPLGMKDSFYGDPDRNGPRCTNIYGPKAEGELQVIGLPLGMPHSRFREHPFGGAGLTMTLMDYAKFGQMLLNKGQLNGTQILGRKTVELMRTNHLPSEIGTFFPGFGYGLGVGVCTSPAEWGNLGSVGQYGWGGAATTWVIIDPDEALVALVFSQHVPADGDFLRRATTLVYQAIVD